MVTNFKFLEKENTLYELALFAEDLIVDGTTRLEYITAIDNMRKVLGLMMTRWTKKANITDEDIRAASKANAEAKGKDNASREINLFSRMIALEAYGCVRHDAAKKLHHIRITANNTIHPEESDGKIFETSKDDVYKIARELYAELYECAYIYERFQARKEPVDRQTLEEFKDYLRNNNFQKNRNNNSSKKNDKQASSKDKAKPENIIKPEEKITPKVKPLPEEKSEAAEKLQPEIKAEAVEKPQHEQKPDPVDIPQPVPTPKVDETPAGDDNQFNEYTAPEGSHQTSKNGFLRRVLWSPVVYCSAAFLWALIGEQDADVLSYESYRKTSLIVALIVSLIYLITSLVRSVKPRKKKSVWQFVISLALVICSFFTAFLLGGSIGGLLMIVLIVCSLVCMIDEMRYKYKGIDG